MRLAVEEVVSLAIADHANFDVEAATWGRMRRNIAVRLMEHLEAGPCRVEVMRYTHDEPESRRKRLEYVVLINETPENRPNVSVPEWARPSYASTSPVNWESVILGGYARNHEFDLQQLRPFPDRPATSLDNPTTPITEPTDDWI